MKGFELNVSFIRFQTFLQYITVLTLKAQGLFRTTIPTKFLVSGKNDWGIFKKSNLRLVALTYMLLFYDVLIAVAFVELK